MAGTTGLEPATSAVTGQRSNQLSYVPRLHLAIWIDSMAGSYRRTYISGASTDTSLSDGDLFVSRCYVAREDFEYLLWAL
jgi:hypothetical protein